MLRADDVEVAGERAEQVADGRGVFYTNLEDKDRTLAIDLRSRAVTKTWLPKCGEAGETGAFALRCLPVRG